MQFTARKRRHPPTVIIISLIDILIVLLIFLMVTTTFKQRPAVTISLPESKQAAPGGSQDHLLITISKSAPFLYLNTEAVTPDDLEQHLIQAVANRPDLAVVIEPDKDATAENMLRAMDAARAARVGKIQWRTKTPPATP